MTTLTAAAPFTRWTGDNADEVIAFLDRCRPDWRAAAHTGWGDPFNGHAFATGGTEAAIPGHWLWHEPGHPYRLHTSPPCVTCKGQCAVLVSADGEDWQPCGDCSGTGAFDWRCALLIENERLRSAANMAGPW